MSEIGHEQENEQYEAHVDGVDKEYESNLQVLSFPLLDRDAKDEVTSSLLALEDAKDNEPVLAGAGFVESLSPLAMGNDDMKNIFYVNFSPDANKLTDEQRKSLTALQTNLALVTNHLSVQRGILTQQKIDSKDLPQDMSMAAQFARGTFRAQVTDQLFRNSAWIRMESTQTRNQSYSMEQTAFNKKLSTDVFKNINMQTSAFPKLEGILKMISDIISSNRLESSYKKLFWIMITQYKWEPARRAIKPSLRTIYFEATDERTTSTSQNMSTSKVDVKLGFAQADFAFDNNVFETKGKSNIQQVLAAATTDNLDKPVDIPVDLR